MIEFFTIPAQTLHSATIILVHGLGDSGHGLKQLATTPPSSNPLSWGTVNSFSHMRSSPKRAITANSGRQMPAWYDVRSFSPPAADDEAQMLESLAWLEGLIDNEVAAGIALQRIVVGGFSQGGTMSLLLALVSKLRVRGVAVLSGRLPLRDAQGGYSRAKELSVPQAASTPIFWGHGKADAVLTYTLALTSIEYLTSEIGVPPSTGGTTGLTFNAYEELGHSISSQEIDDLVAWLQNIVP
ncbi:hypothetical protein MIND_00438200 [Mycena indigotica]|uniref:Acyl-protein thioesterase 1 n=1 Tax=Mycena indigotica TaxID=2126181 RepID=A0A8H6SUL6_9AGAR|nr:uncharacterized protein MIND_00438200 [Mycena indigotica]KAF7306470.1 hypothetical protein MIND_00438200 [Mycena indigotica]